MEKKTLLNKKCDQQQKLNGYNGVWKGGSGWQKKNQKGGILLKGMGGEKMESGSSSSFQMFEYNYALTQRVITSLVLASSAAIKGWRVFVVVGAKKNPFCTLCAHPIFPPPILFSLQHSDRVIEENFPPLELFANVGQAGFELGTLLSLQIHLIPFTVMIIDKV